ncbi:hypothetical protein EV13_3033 [Prochlorococcus sp. MIT 0702]|nr:hypothetical protein EV13_3033 [Prochlorococcus sp. MIT 0702]
MVPPKSPARKVLRDGMVMTNEVKSFPQAALTTRDLQLLRWIDC